MTLISSCLPGYDSEDVIDLLWKDLVVVFGAGGTIAVAVPFAFVPRDPIAPSARNTPGGPPHIASTPLSDSPTLESGVGPIVVPSDGIPVVIDSEDHPQPFTTDPPPARSPRTSLFPIPEPEHDQSVPFSHLEEEDFQRDIPNRVTVCNASVMGDTESVRAIDPESRPPSPFSHHSGDSGEDQPPVPSLDENWKERNPDGGPLRWSYGQLREASRRHAMQVGASKSESPSEEALRQLGATMAAVIHIENERMPPAAYSHKAQDYARRTGNMWSYVRSMYAFRGHQSSEEAVLAVLKMLVYSCAHYGHIPLREVLSIIHVLENQNADDSTSLGGDSAGNEEEDDGPADEGGTLENFNHIMSIAERHHLRNSLGEGSSSGGLGSTLSGPYIYSPLPYSLPFGDWDGSPLVPGPPHIIPGESEGQADPAFESEEDESEEDEDEEDEEDEDEEDEDEEEEELEYVDLEEEEEPGAQPSGVSSAPAAADEAGGADKEDLDDISL